MGIMISYMGQLADPNRIDDLLRDVRELADSREWRTWTVAQLTAEGYMDDSDLTGLTVSVHDECEPVHLHFDTDGHFVNHAYYSFLKNDSKRSFFLECVQQNTTFFRSIGLDLETANRYTTQQGGITFHPILQSTLGDDPDVFFRQGLYYNWTKTQHGGVEAHERVCELLRLVRDRYAPELDITDDTGFFEHGRRDVLEAALGEIDKAIYLATLAMQRIQKESGSVGVEEIADKLSRYMSEELDQLH